MRSSTSKPARHGASIPFWIALFTTVTLASATPIASAQTIGSGAQISLQSAHGRFLVAEPDGRLEADRDSQGAWERFQVIPVAVPSPNQPLRFGDQVLLRSAHGTHVVARPGGAAEANSQMQGPSETWTVVSPFDPGSTSIVRVRDAVALRSAHDTFLVAEPDGRANADRTQIGAWETWRIGLEWTDFYYDRAAACAPGECCPCPYRGRFDGANCFVARPPVGTAPLLVDRGFFYESQAQGQCPLGSPEGARCQVGRNPKAPPPFLYEGGFYLSSLCSLEGELRVEVERVGYCGGPFGPPLCGHRLTRGEFQPWRDSGVSEQIQRNTQLGIVFGPTEQPARRVALLFSGQQPDQVLDPGIGNQVTGQPDGFRSGWSFREPRRFFTLDEDSLAQEILEEELLDPADSFLAVAFDARFNHKFTPANKDRIENAYFRWLRSKFDPAQVELVYLAGHSRGGCLAMRLAQRIQQEMPQVPVVAQSFDGVCNRNQRELGIQIPGRVNSPVGGSGAYAWPTNLREEFRNQQSSLALLQIAGGHPFFLGDLAVRAFSQVRADQPELDLCWYQQRWVDLSHSQLGGFRIVQPALDHLEASLERFANGPACAAVGECVKDPAVLAPFECNDLFAQDCAAQTECRLENRCRRVSGSLTCRDLSGEAECNRYGEKCRWRRGRCRGRPFQFFECNDLTAGDCGNHSECSLRQECRRQSGSLTCGDLFTQELCDRYTRWCDWL